MTGGRMDVWDGENRLVRQFGPTTGPAGSVKALAYGYDWQGRRISKTVSNYTGGAWSKVLDERYLYDGWNLVAVLNATNNALIKSFLWGNDLSGTLQGAGGVGGLLAMNVAGGAVYFAAFDGNGNVAALVNGGDGTVGATYEYGPFGEVIRASGTIARVNPFRFSTKFHDEETDLLCYGYRYYSASLGRWLSRDPLGERGGMNVLGFDGNDLINAYDIDGRMKREEIDEYVRKLNMSVTKIRCCDPCKGIPNVRVEITGSAVDSSVVVSAKIINYGKCPMMIHRYYWWNCFQANWEATAAGLKIGGRGGLGGNDDHIWQDYGYYFGSEVDTQTHVGAIVPPRMDIQDVGRWNFFAGVIYIYCAKNGFLTARSMDASHQLQFTWDGKAWTNPLPP